MEDNEVIKQVLSKDPDAYAILVRKYSARVLSLCHSMMGAKNAEDAAQEIFLKVYQSLKRFRGDARFSTWLYRIAYNHCLDSLKKEKRQKAESWERLIEDHGEAIHQLFSAKPDERGNFENRELVHQVLKTLPEDYHTILTLREISGLSYQEIAELTHSTLDSVKARLRRAREAFESQLRHFLEKEIV